MSKRGSLSLSIEVIVIVVIAFVVLGLGLGFVRSQFKTIEETASSVQEQIRQQILDDLRTGNKKLSFPATQLALETNEESVQAIGVKNTEDTPLTLQVQFEVDTKDGFKPFSPAQPFAFVPVGGTDETSSVLLWDNSPVSFKAGEARVIPVTITAPTRSGNYLYKVKIVREDGTTLYDERTFFIKTS
ncbi:hypothetical protein HYS49_00585 [Candidatus Woesearchaeota archaeon]|nr:hypothetical protein [Candidatus Woesearchaeota archaeon]